mmetsp:Transcript_29275/g.46731  ORF Transcript_29275/g.46731 Transcript_29275/m.46731 type:complete len:137 (-) Transcript_29275:126-536(-)
MKKKASKMNFLSSGSQGRDKGGNKSRYEPLLSDTTAVIKLIVDAIRTKIRVFDPKLNKKDKTELNAFDYCQSNTYISALLQAEADKKKLKVKSTSTTSKMTSKGKNLAATSPGRTEVKSTNQTGKRPESIALQVRQ